MRGKQSAGKAVWYIGKKGRYKKRKKRGQRFSIGLLASTALPIVGEVAKAILKKIRW